MIASMNGNISVVRILSNLGANKLLEASNGKTARDFAEDALFEA